MYIGNISGHQQYDRINKSIIYQDDRMQLILLNLPSGSVMKPHTSNKDAYCVVQKGRVEFTLEDDLFLLKEGDVFHFKAGQLHALKALSDFSMLIIK